MKVNKRWSLALWLSLAILALQSVLLLPPTIEGDTPSYVEAVAVLEGVGVPEGFIPNRILTTFGALATLSLLAKFIGIFGGWVLINLAFYFVLSVTFYYLTLRIFKSQATALLATIFLASSYSLLQFGLTYLMDIGGWAFYVISIYFSYRYIESEEYKNLLYAGAAVGVGALFKEYAFLAAIPIAVILISQYWRTPLSVIKKAVVPAVLSLLPVVIVYLYVFKTFDYSYLDWLSFNQDYYVYSSRLVEYIKSLGSLYNFLAPVVLGGLYALICDRNNTDYKLKLFVISVLISILPVFFWPAITQRILFITVPAMLLIGSFLLKKYQRYWWAFTPILILYILASFTMDYYILSNLNLPF